MAQKKRKQRGFAARGQRILPAPRLTGGWISTGGCYPARMKNVRSRVVQHGGLDRQGTDKFSETKSRSRHNFLTAVLPPSILFAVLTAVTESLKVLEQTIHLYGEDACQLAVNAGKDSTAVLHLCETRPSPLQTNPRAPPPPPQRPCFELLCAQSWHTLSSLVLLSPMCFRTQRF